MSGREEVGESSTPLELPNKMAPHAKQTVEDMNKEIDELHKKCHLIAGLARGSGKRMDNLQKAMDQLKRVWVRNLRGVGDDLIVKELTDDFERKARGLKVEFDNEEHRRKEMLQQYRELQSAAEDKFKLLQSLKNEYPNA